MSNPSLLSFIVPPEDAGERLDSWLAGRLGLARNQAQIEIKSGLVTINGAPAAAAHRIRAGETIAAPPRPPVPPPVLEPSDRPLEVFHEDDHLLIINKPAGLVVLPALGHTEDTLAHALLARCGRGIEHVGGPGRCGIVHRLDKLTSGLLLVARTPEVHRTLTEDLAERRIERRYLALAVGIPRPARGEIEQPVGRRRNDRKRMGVVADGRPSRTAYRVLTSVSGFSLVLLKLFTGRTHQIRVHLQHAGHPVFGDPEYGWTKARTLQGLPAEMRNRLASDWPDRQMLHAAGLRLNHPATGALLQCTSPPPDDMTAVMALVLGKLTFDLMKEVTGSLEGW